VRAICCAGAGSASLAAVAERDGALLEAATAFAAATGATLPGAADATTWVEVSPAAGAGVDDIHP
jgi:hypothetical protein